MREIELPVCGIRLELHETPDATADDTTTARPLVMGTITSELREPLTSFDNIDAQIELYNARVDGLESLILACACAGVDVETREFDEAVNTAVDAILNAD